MPMPWATRQVAAELGPIDILVNNAGIPPEGMALTPFLDTKPANSNITGGPVQSKPAGVISTVQQI